MKTKLKEKSVHTHHLFTEGENPHCLRCGLMLTSLNEKAACPPWDEKPFNFITSDELYILKHARGAIGGSLVFLSGHEKQENKLSKAWKQLNEMILRYQDSGHED